MKLINDLEKVGPSFGPTAITIGNFDGVHIGHQALFRKTIETARRMHGTAVAMTFEPHPSRALGQETTLPLITLFEQKAELIARSGIDVLICIPFTRAFADIPAGRFVEDILYKKIGMRAIIVGEDYAYGRNREGNLATLRGEAARLGFDVLPLSDVPFSGAGTDRISSTRIRELVMEGKVAAAAGLLGRRYQIRGAVVTGRDRGGKLLGFPTANVQLQDELCPKTGVYAVTVECIDATYDGVANIGYSPTFDDHIYTVEVHLLGFNQDIYGQKIRVNFIDRIRDEMKFKDIRRLSDQIRKDIAAAERLLHK